MKKILIVFLVIMWTLVGCSSLSTTMVKVEDQEKSMAHGDSKAAIVFMRPSSHGDVIESAIYHLNDGEDDFLGFVSSGKKVVTIVEPGEHRFMVINQHMTNADFMIANVKEGKTYHAVVSPRGWPNILFALRPNKDKPVSDKFSRNSEQFKEWVLEAELMKKTPAADDWAQKNRVPIHGLKDSVYPRWKEKVKGNLDRYSLNPEDGV